MAKIIGNTTATPNPRSDWEQTDSAKADYIKNKPTLGTLAAKSEVAKTDLAPEVQATLDKEVYTKTEVDTAIANKTTFDSNIKVNKTNVSGEAILSNNNLVFQFDDSGYNLTGYGYDGITYYAHDDNGYSGKTIHLDDIVTNDILNSAMDQIYEEITPLDPSNAKISKIISTNYDLSGKTIKVKSLSNNYPDWCYGRVYFSDGSYLQTCDNYYSCAEYINSNGETSQFYHEYLNINDPFVLPENISISRLTLQYQDQGLEYECDGKEFDSQIGLVLEIS